jgi:hypothetical protein
MSHALRVFATCLFLIGCGGGADGDDKPNPNPSGYTTEGLRDAAKQIYDARDAGEDLRPYVTIVLAGFGVNVSSAMDGPALQAELTAGKPLVLPPQIDELSAAFTDGVLVTLDSFVATMALRGATVEASGEPLSVFFLEELMTPVLASTELGPEQTLLAWVAILGQERAARDGTVTDPVWGDRALDPIQFVLLLNAVMYSGPDHPASGPTFWSGPTLGLESVGAVGGEVGGYVEGLVETQVAIPITTETAAKTSLCASLVLYGYKTTITVTPNPIWHHQLDGVVPWTAVMKATLTFQDDYWDNYYGPKKDLIDVAECSLPKQGPAEDGLELEWDASAPLPEHGSFDIAASTTNGGEAVATFRAIEEKVPAAKRIFDNQRDAVGRVKIQATGALPGWETLEWFVTNLKETGTAGTANLTILYYIDPCVPTNLEGGLAALTCAPSWNGTVVADQFSGAKITGSVDFKDGVNNAGTVTYPASGTITYEQAGCTFAPASYTLSPTEGQLVVDYTKTPATYSGGGIANWAATMTCGSDDPVPTFVGGFWFTVPADPNNVFEVSADGLTMEGSISDFSGAFSWKLTQGPG